MKHIAFYLTPYPPERSGIADYAKCFKQAVEEHTDWCLELANHEQRVIGNSLKDIFKLYRRIKRWEKEEVFQHISLIHAEIGYKQHDEFYTLLLLRFMFPKVPYYITIHDPPLVIAPALYFLSFGLKATLVRHALRLIDYSFIGKIVVQSVLSNAKGIFILSTSGNKALKQVHGEYKRVQYLPHINLRSSRKENYKLRSDASVKILYMGFWGRFKGFEVLLKAFEQVVDHTSVPVHLLMAGGFEQGNTNKKYVFEILNAIENSSANHAIEVLGYIPTESIDSTFDNADIFVLPYIQGLGFSSSGVLIRAMAAGLAIIASDVGVISEDIKHLETGLLVPPGDFNALSQALLLMINNQEMRLSLGKNAQNHVFDEHQATYVSSIVSDVYELTEKNVEKTSIRNRTKHENHD